METEPDKSLESKTNCSETEEDQVIPPKYRDKDWKDVYFVTL
jgi:hypothetical protein